MKTVSVILNILLLSAAIFLFVRGNFWDKTIYLIRERRDIKNTYTYDMNRMYEVKKNMHMSYEKKARIVMLGNSLTEHAEWNELLQRDDVVNRGIGGDITEGMLNRIESVLKVKPELCFFMGGINDLIKRVSYSKTVENIVEIIQILNNNEIKPVILSVLYVGRSYPCSEMINAHVENINKDLIRISEEKSAGFLDLNKDLTENGFLKDKYTYDGLHLNVAAYKIWSERLNEYLEIE
ncbi:MAG: GDSL-type esterase/lipase family protein [Candidatus Delongbacteria bacterium]